MFAYGLWAFVSVLLTAVLALLLQARVTANGRVGATAAVYTAAILGKFNSIRSCSELC